MRPTTWCHRCLPMPWLQWFAVVCLSCFLVFAYQLAFFRSIRITCTSRLWRCKRCRLPSFLASNMSCCTSKDDAAYIAAQLSGHRPGSRAENKLLSTARLCASRYHHATSAQRKTCLGAEWIRQYSADTYCVTAQPNTDIDVRKAQDVSALVESIFKQGQSSSLNRILLRLQNPHDTNRPLPHLLSGRQVRASRPKRLALDPQLRT